MKAKVFLLLCFFMIGAWLQISMPGVEDSSTLEMSGRWSAGLGRRVAKAHSRRACGLAKVWLRLMSHETLSAPLRWGNLGSESPCLNLISSGNDGATPHSKGRPTNGSLCRSKTHIASYMGLETLKAKVGTRAGPKQQAARRAARLVGRHRGGLPTLRLMPTGMHEDLLLQNLALIQSM